MARFKNNTKKQTNKKPIPVWRYAQVAVGHHLIKIKILIINY